MNAKIVSWNARELNGVDKKRLVKQRIHQRGAIIQVLFETKLDGDVRIGERLSQWKAQYLSLGGRVTLVNSVLDSLSTHVMSLFFPIPSNVAKKLDRLRRDILWKCNKEGLYAKMCRY